MIVINECAIIDSTLILEATVDTLEFYKDVEIGSVIIDTEDTFVDGGPSNNPILVREFADAETESSDSDDPKWKHIRITISAKEMGLSNLSNNLFFVYIGATGYPSPVTPCNMDNQYTVAVAFDLKSIYNGAMQYLKEIESCEIPRTVIDYILRVKALEISIRTGNLKVAIKYWRKLFKSKGTIKTTSNCGCNGSET